jgi:HlyD family secretion protein
MGKTTKVFIALIIIALGGGVVAWTYAKGQKKSVEVRIEPVERRDLIASVTASGQVEPHTKVDISSDITGKIIDLGVKEGQWVKVGDFLLQIDPQNAQAAVEHAKAALASSQAQEAQTHANLTQANSSYTRSAAIKRTNPTLISDEEIEQLKTTVNVDSALYQASQHDVDQAQASLHDAQTSLDKTRILAPMAGKITRLNVEQGETAIMGTLNKDAATLMTISDMSILETRVKVDETDVARIKIGDSSVVQIDAFPDTTFFGRVTKISNSSVAGSTTTASTDQAVDYEVTVQLLNTPAETRPDFSTTAKIVTDKVKNALSVPIIALTVREDSAITNGDTAVGLGKARPAKEVGKRDVEGVFVVDTGGKVTFRPVKVGIAGEKHFEILDGLRPGERIVAGSYHAIRDLKDGMFVHEAKVDTKKPGVIK